MLIILYHMVRALTFCLWQSVVLRWCRVECGMSGASRQAHIFYSQPTYFTSYTLCPNTLSVPCPTAPRFLRSEGLRCGRCSRTFNSSEQYIDLTVSSGAKRKVYERKEWAGTELFR